MKNGGIVFREETGRNGGFFYRLPVPEGGTGKRFAGYYGELTGLLSALSPECGYTSVIGSGRTEEGEYCSVLLLYRLYRGESLAGCYLQTTVWDEEGNAVPLAALIGPKRARQAEKTGIDGWFVREGEAVFCRYGIENEPGGGRVRAVFRETGTEPLLCRKNERGL